MRIVEAQNGRGRFTDRIVNQFPVILRHGDDALVVLVERQVKRLLMAVGVRQRHRPKRSSVDNQVEIPRRGDFPHRRFQHA